MRVTPQLIHAAEGVMTVRTRLPYPNDPKADLYGTLAQETPFFREILRRKISRSHNVATRGMANSRHQMLRPEARPKSSNVLRLGTEVDPIDAKSSVRIGIERKYQE